MIESEADRQSALRDLGEPLTAGGKSFPCIFRDGFEPIDFGDSVVSGQVIRAIVTDQDAASMKAVRGLIVTVRGQQYKVENAERDGTGMTNLELTNAH